MLGFGDVKFAGERIDQEDDDEKIERIQGPAEEAGEDGVPVGFGDGGVWFKV